VSQTKTVGAKVFIKLALLTAYVVGPMIAALRHF